MQKVMAIVCLQLLFAALVATLFYVCAPLKVRPARLNAVFT